MLIAAIWGLAFLVSVPIRRPLAGALACAWCPAMLVLMLWSIRYALHGLADVEPPVDETLAAAAA